MNVFTLREAATEARDKAERLHDDSTWTEDLGVASTLVGEAMALAQAADAMERAATLLDRASMKAAQRAEYLQRRGARAR